MSIETKRGYKPRLFIEGRYLQVESVMVNTGVNKVLTAQIVLPPNKYAHKLVPGSRVMVSLQQQGGEKEEIAWFQGKVLNQPSTEIGPAERPILLHVVGDIGALQEADLEFFNINQAFSTDVKHLQRIAQSTRNGTIKMPVHPLIAPYVLTEGLLKANKSFAGRVYGTMQRILFMKPDLYNQLRKTCFLDRLLIDIHDPSNRLIQGNFLSSIFKNAIKGQSLMGKNAWDVLMRTLRIIHHDFVSIAPMIKTKTKIPKRQSFAYLPKGLNIYSSKKKDWDGLYDTTDDDVTTSIDHLIKPMLIGMGAPSCNILEPNEYEMTLFSPNNQTTRMGFSFSLIGPGGTGGTLSENRPYELTTAKEISDGYISTVSTSDAQFSLKSSMLQSLGSDYTTNEEKILGRTGWLTHEGDPNITSVMAQKKDPKYQDFWGDYCDVMYNAVRSSPVRVQGPMNLTPVCGFPLLLRDNEGEHILGYLNEKIDFIDYKNGVESTQYIITHADSETKPNYNQPKFNTNKVWLDTSNAEEVDDLFYKDTQKVRAPEFMNTYDYGSLYEKITGDRRYINSEIIDSGSKITIDKTYVNYQEFLALNRVKIKKKGYFPIMKGDDRDVDKWDDNYYPERRYVKAAQEFKDVNDLKDAKAIAFKRERFFTRLDLLPIVADTGFRMAKQIDAKTLIKWLDTKGSIWNDQMYQTLIKDESIANLISFDFTNEIMSSSSDWDVVDDWIKPHDSQKAFWSNRVKIPACPIWDGNPSPDRTSLLLHYLSLSDKTIKNVHDGSNQSLVLPTDSKGVLTETTVVSVEDKISRLEYLPRPLSERGVLTVRRFVLDQMAEEDRKVVR